MFNNCNNLRTIYATQEGWDVSNVSKSGTMFFGCTSLSGGMGTTYDEAHTSCDYAHIDGGPSNPGYFTDKSAIPTSINSAESVDDPQRFAPDGMRIVGTHRGLNIIRQADGSVRKVMVK